MSQTRGSVGPVQKHYHAGSDGWAEVVVRARSSERVFARVVFPLATGLSLILRVAAPASGDGLIAMGSATASYGPTSIFNETADVTDAPFHVFDSDMLSSGGDVVEITADASGSQGSLLPTLMPPTATADASFVYLNPTGYFPSGWGIVASSTVEYSFTIVATPGAPFPSNNFDVQFRWSASHAGAVPPNLGVLIRSELLTSTGSGGWSWSGSLHSSGLFLFSFIGLNDVQQQAVQMELPFPYTLGSGRYTIRQTAHVGIAGIISGQILGSAAIDPIITVGPGLEPYYSIVYDPGVFVPEPGPTTLAAAALLTLGALRLRRDPPNGSRASTAEARA